MSEKSKKESLHHLAMDSTIKAGVLASVYFKKGSCHGCNYLLLIPLLSLFDA